MAGGRGSAIRACLVVGIAIVCLLALSDCAFGANYTVGDSGGWTFNVNNWPKGKSFKAGDVLEFKYLSMHNVAVVNRKGYTKCRKSKGAKVYKTGDDSLKLKKGHNYFICLVPGHCQAGMKIDVYATKSACNTTN